MIKQKYQEGNIVNHCYDGDEYQQVTVVGVVYDRAHIQFATGGGTDVDIKTIEPIPITPEWLNRCGFIGLNHLGKKEYSLVIDENLTIEVCFYAHLVVRLVTRNENYDENINLGEFLTYRDIPQCEHVHQLQNLYFVLTCEELTIN